MSENTLGVRITADILDFNTKFGVASATAKALKKDFDDLAKQSAAGLLDPAGLAQLQEASRAMLEAKATAAELKEQLQGTREESSSLGEAFEGLRGKISNAFEVTGIAVAYEGIKEITEAIEQAGQRMLEMRTNADVLGVSTDQFQAMGAAAEEAGVPVETLTRAAERLSAMLTEARDGSGAAVEKLKTLGLTLDQIHDPAFTVADVMLVLHDRLTDSATATNTMNELVRELGARAGLTAEAIKKLDLSQEGMSETLAKLHSLTKREIDDGAELAIKVGEQHTKIANSWDRIILKAQEYAQWAKKNLSFAFSAIPSIDATSHFLTGEEPKEESKEHGEKSHGSDSGTIDRGEAEQSAQAQMALQNEIQLQELHNIEVGVEAFKEGSQRKLEQLQIFYTATAAYYGADSDKALAAQRRVISETRAYTEEVEKDLKERTNFAGEANKEIYEEAEQLNRQLGSLVKEETRERESQWKEQQRAHEQYMKSVERDQLQQNKELVKAYEDMQKSWDRTLAPMRQAFGAAFADMIMGAKSFGDAVRSMFASIAQSALDTAGKNIAAMAMQAVTGKGFVSEEIRQDAGAAAAGAYKSIVGIPYVGPILAPIAAATAYTAVLAFDSAEGGYDIPKGMNPVVQTHAEEMILPARYANVVRDMADQPGGGSGRSGSVVHLHAKSGSDLITVDQVVDMLRKANQRCHRSA